MMVCEISGVNPKMRLETETTIFTIGHSTRTLVEAIGILKAYGVALVVDVRSVPRSRHNPQFNKETLPEVLKAESIKYVYMIELGGLRKPQPNSENLAWESRTFRGYADYMQTREFTEELLKLMTLTRENCISIMCTEAVPWRCHRSLIADALLVRHFKVKHILNATSFINHDLTPFAYVEGSRITYPLFVKEKPQRTLAEF